MPGLRQSAAIGTSRFRSPARRGARAARRSHRPRRRPGEGRGSGAWSRLPPAPRARRRLGSRRGPSSRMCPRAVQMCRPLAREWRGRRLSTTLHSSRSFRRFSKSCSDLWRCVTLWRLGSHRHAPQTGCTKTGGQHADRAGHAVTSLWHEPSDIW